MNAKGFICDGLCFGTEPADLVDPRGLPRGSPFPVLAVRTGLLGGEASSLRPLPFQPGGGPLGACVYGGPDVGV